jgi:hypothetical protein
MTDFGIGWRVQPGTALRDRAVAEGLLDPKDDCWDPHFYVSPDTPIEWLRTRLLRFRFTQAHLAARMIPFIWRVARKSMK